MTNDDHEYLPYSREGTSKDAAMSQRGKTAITREKVYAFIAAAGDHGATNSEIAEGTRMPLYTAAPRATELQYAKRIVASGRTRPTVNGRASIVWVLASQPPTCSETVRLGDEWHQCAREPGHKGEHEKIMGGEIEGVIMRWGKPEQGELL